MERKFWKLKCRKTDRSVVKIKGWNGWKYVLCVGGGIVFFLAAETVDNMSGSTEQGVVFRNPCGQGEAVYEFYVDGLRDDTDFKGLSEGNQEQHSSVKIQLHVPEKELSEEEFEQQLSEIAELLCQRILGSNRSLYEVRSDLELITEIPEYGIDVSWESEHPEIIGSDGLIGSEFVGEYAIADGVEVYLTAELKSGTMVEILEIPVIVYPETQSKEQRFQEMIEQLVLEHPEQEKVVLPKEFEGQALYYQSVESSSNVMLLLLGAAAAVVMFLKEKEAVVVAGKKRESSLMADYPDLVYEFLILTGAGYSAKGAWKKLTEDAQANRRKSDHPLYHEMQITMNQMETGTPEIRAYMDFGRRCGIRSYTKFASLLESSVSTGGKNLRRLLEEEVEEAFQIRADTAKRNGELASSKLLIPMFGMLSVVMVMVVAPAFLSLNG